MNSGSIRHIYIYHVYDFMWKDSFTALFCYITDEPVNIGRLLWNLLSLLQRLNIIHPPWAALLEAFNVTLQSWRESEHWLKGSDDLLSNVPWEECLLQWKWVEVSCPWLAEYAPLLLYRPTWFCENNEHWKTFSYIICSFSRLAHLPDNCLTVIVCCTLWR